VQSVEEACEDLLNDKRALRGGSSGDQLLLLVRESIKEVLASLIKEYNPFLDIEIIRPLLFFKHRLTHGETKLTILIESMSLLLLSVDRMSGVLRSPLKTNLTRCTEIMGTLKGNKRS